MDLGLALPPKHHDNMDNHCWLVASATFLGLSFYEAHALLLGGPPPGKECWRESVMHLDDLEAKLKGLGIVRARRDYENASEPRLVFGCFCTRAGYWQTLHAVVWDPVAKTRLDPSEYDTFVRRSAKVVRVFRRLSNAPSVITGVTIQPPSIRTDDALSLAA